ncbi:radical SAM/SPASM domain-containing protein, partial [Planctomycetota bacterium]
SWTAHGLWIDFPAESHDAVRGVEGSFARSLKILRRARLLGIATQINTTLTPDNVDQVDEMAKIFAGLDITLWSVFFLIPVGRADTAARLSADECESVFSKLWQHSQTQPYMLKTTESPHFRRYAIQHQPSKAVEKEAQNGDQRPKRFQPLGVNDGKGIMFVSHTGTIHPSGFMPITCGVFPQQHVVQVYQDSPIFRGLRDADRLEGKCGACEFRNICGGSRARAYALTGNPYAEEPDCVYVPPSMDA